MSKQGSPAPAKLSRVVLEGVNNRDPGALAALFDSHFDAVYGLAYRLLGERAAAEDVAQDVFLKLHRVADRLDPDRDPGPWLFTTTTNACRDVWRSGAHKMASRPGSAQDPMRGARERPAAGPDPEGELLARERERLVQEALLRLPPSLRETVVLHDYQGLGHEEIAGILRTSHAAVRKRHSRAIELLGEMLREQLR